jgi:hypothetical protein
MKGMLHLTRAQRRQMQKRADRGDSVTQADRRFFEQVPLRKHRVRLSSQAEISQQEVLEGKPVFHPAGCRVFTVVRNVAAGIRLRLYVRGIEGAETDLDEATARAIFEASASPRTWEIEAQLRKAAEMRG